VADLFFLNRVPNPGSDIDNVTVAGGLFGNFLGLKRDHAIKQV